MVSRIKKIVVGLALCVLMVLPALIVSGQGTIAGNCSCGCKGKETNGCCKGYSASRITKECHEYWYDEYDDPGVISCYWYKCTDPKTGKYCKGNSTCSTACLIDYGKKAGE